MKKSIFFIVISVFLISCKQETVSENAYICKISPINPKGGGSIKYYSVNPSQLEESDSCAMDSIFYEYIVFDQDTLQYWYTYLYPEYSRAKVYAFITENGNLKADTLQFLELPTEVINGRKRHYIHNGYKKSWPKKSSYRYWIWYDSTNMNSKIDTLLGNYSFYKVYVDSSYILGFRPCESSKFKVNK